MNICIIKLGALGDLVRTLPIAKAISDSHLGSKITWITKNKALDFLKNQPFISEAMQIPCQIKENFDILYNFDIEDEATSLADLIKAEKKFGFYKEAGFVQAFNLGAEYYLNTLFDDGIKKSNRKTYQEMMFMAAEMPYKNELVPLILSEQSKEYASDFVKANNLRTEKLIGIHFGASSRWPSKIWHKSNLKEFIGLAKQEGYEIMLFGGPNETAELKSLASEMSLCHNNPNNTNLEFASLVDKCSLMICSDSFALHISLALKKPTIALFFCTSPDEVEGYRLLKKIASPLIGEFFPERMDQYSEELVKSISASEVIAEVKNIIHRNK